MDIVAARKGTFTVLLSSAGRRVSLLRSMREGIAAAGMDARILASDMNELSPAMHTADARFIVPSCRADTFADSMIELCQREKVDLVIPTIDTELPIWAALKAPLAESGTVVAVSSPEAIAIAADKRATHAHCNRIGAPRPRQATLSEVDDTRHNWSPPFIVKPATGSASAGVQTITAWEQFDRALADDDPDLIAEERLPGIEHTVDVYVCRAGTVHCPVVRRRLEVRAGEVSKARVVRDERLAAIAVDVVRHLPGAYGVLNVQIFADETTAAVLEINARFGGGYPLTWRVGGRYSEWLVRDVAYGEAPPQEPSIEYDLTMLRWDEEVFVRD